MFTTPWGSQKKYHSLKRKRWHAILFAVFWFVLWQKHKCMDSTDENWFCVPHREHLNSGGKYFLKNNKTDIALLASVNRLSFLTLWD